LNCRLLLAMPVPPDARKSRVRWWVLLLVHREHAARSRDGNSSAELFRPCRLSGRPQARYISLLSLCSIRRRLSRPFHTVQNVRSNSGGRVGRLCLALRVRVYAAPRCTCTPYCKNHYYYDACTGGAKEVLCNRHYVSGMERVGLAQRDTVILFHFEQKLSVPGPTGRPGLL
jgi:hypothetical protein